MFDLYVLSSLNLGGQLRTHFLLPFSPHLKKRDAFSPLDSPILTSVSNLASGILPPPTLSLLYPTEPPDPYLLPLNSHIAQGSLLLKQIQQLVTKPFQPLRAKSEEATWNTTPSSPRHAPLSPEHSELSTFVPYPGLRCSLSGRFRPTLR